MTETTNPQHVYRVYRVSEISDGVVRRIHGYFASLEGAFGYCETEERKHPLVDGVRFDLFPAPGEQRWLLHIFAPCSDWPETSDFVISQHEVIGAEKPAVPSAPAAQTVLRDRIAAALRAAACTGDCGMSELECARSRIQPEVWHRGVLAEVSGTPEMLANVVLAVIPEPADRAAGPAALREAAAFYETVLHQSLSPDSDPRYCTAVRDIVMGLRRRADEAQPAEFEFRGTAEIRAAVLREAATMLDQRATGIDAFASSDYGAEAQAVRELAAAANELRRVADEAQQPETQADTDPVYDPRAWETYRRDAGCGCTAPAPVDCKIPHGTGAWLCVCHRLSGPPIKETDPSGQPLSLTGEGVRAHFLEPNRCLSVDGIFRCSRPTGHLGDHRTGRTFWGRRAEDEQPAVVSQPGTEATS